MPLLKINEWLTCEIFTASWKLIDINSTKQDCWVLYYWIIITDQIKIEWDDLILTFLHLKSWNIPTYFKKEKKLSIVFKI